MKKVFILLVLLTGMAFTEANEPTWLMSVPTANVLPKNTLSAGIIYLDLSISEGLEIGAHGIKYQLSKDFQGGRLALGASFVFGLYPYAVWTKNLDFGELSIGVNPFPYFVFASIETKLSDTMRFIGEVHNGAAVGLRNNIAKGWWLDVGAGLTVYPYKNYMFYDFTNNDYFYYKFPTTFSPYIVISLCYNFDISPVAALPEIKPESKPLEDGPQPIDPVKR
ncbi:MAG: hypothetical protein A2231_05105 [Candidatus Firestonebacteria bacterium RIFOXYA2_FULL_40_8]|nr:MAG: hypothetical protein A2231_05105 [Candidatus Firestonebacteria bacterium RIFOXYA2_FULL_40_8]